MIYSVHSNVVKNINMGDSMNQEWQNIDIAKLGPETQLGSLYYFLSFFICLKVFIYKYIFKFMW